ncbi:cuticle protein 18.6-like [Centruroides vittatus]|uniref:cuticle protein 18.6-like n=1 Tax=Centruroides vittatus TaxID=120091 RepID=UPI00350F7389
MKFFILIALVAATQAVPIPYGLISTGTSLQYRNQDPIGNYNFGYNEGHATGGTFRREAGDIAGNKVGSYGLVDADGRRRVVNYVADGAGFRANIQTNEPGVDPAKDPAAVAVNKGLLAAPALSYAAPALGYAAPWASAALGYAPALGYAAAPYYGAYLCFHSINMKILIVIALVAATQAVPIPYGLISTGTSLQYRNQDPIGNYNFGYNEGHATGGTFRREAGDIAGNKVGSYGLVDADGRRRVVNYVADGAGFRANIQTNEPGVDPAKDPAAVAVNKGLLAAPALSYAAPALGYAAPWASAALGYAPALGYAAAPYYGAYLW